MNTRQLEIFPLATTSVGWVPDQHTRKGQSEAEDSERSGELCGRAADGEWSAGGSLSLDRYKMSSGFSEALMLCVTVTGLWVSEGRAEAISNYSSCLPGVPQRISRLLLVGLWSNERLKCEF